MTQTASEGGGNSPAFIPLMCLLMIMGLVQVVRPQLIWRLNSRLQRGWVKNPEATEPTRKGYTMQRVVGVLFLAAATWMLVQGL
ncbi:DUF6199 family natural product biosynthesis protein [Streptomyces griseoflavus]|uniref:DUF6199 family natural product biosynthesis protein n=1 Tax=Streptomyces griseoflavus TaxID=35619 RepID=UPI001E36E54D|nr:DUF6199 family natural product biosynthesis protein [Streptomyces griseoflavus]